MKNLNKKRNVAASKAVIITVIIHAIILLLAGQFVVMRFIRSRTRFISEARPKLERRELQMPVKTKPFVEQMSKPKMKKTSRLTAKTTGVYALPEAQSYTRSLAPPSFTQSYTNNITLGRTLQFNSNFRNLNFGIAQVDFFGAKGKGEKVIFVLDASPNMLFDERGGAESYSVLKDDLQFMIDGLPAATLFNIVAFDGHKIALFNPTLTAATADTKERAYGWFKPINADFAHPGLKASLVNYTELPEEYDIPMETDDVVGWLKGLQAAIEQKPEAIFLLGGEWGPRSTESNKISYFPRATMDKEYRDVRAAFFAEDSGLQRDMEDYLEDYNLFRDVGHIMLERENEARSEIGLPPKFVRDWYDIMLENEETFPTPPTYQRLKDMEMSPAETRYAMEEVLESLYIIAMENYRDLGFPSITIVPLVADNQPENNDATSAILTSTAKFKALSKFCKTRTRELPGFDVMENILSQSARDIEKELEPAEGN